ncbi:hypothetical protein L6452_26142 [Arctium lappa]|uniref:Uncharacterized protein n=1 Tax=Arctium lappa TaxID=4217 RepID=A0ACB9AGG9_ARCLA|nr:hypothetical protein L6452_26142 [Arctium lappa]
MPIASKILFGRWLLYYVFSLCQTFYELLPCTGTDNARELCGFITYGLCNMITWFWVTSLENVDGSYAKF